MEDDKIIALYWARDEKAIPATADKYGHYCTAIARNILNSAEDAAECVNDTYLHAWNAMPPHKPSVLQTFLGKLTRNICFNRYQRERAQKRGGGELPVILDELSECVSGDADVEQEIDKRELVQAIDSFLKALPDKKRCIFVRRYWYADSMPAIAERYGMTEGNVSVTLNRLRSKLKAHLTERGWMI